MNAETRRLKDIIIERLTQTLKDRESVSYYELMIGCCHHIGINNFYDLINGMAYSDEIEVDDKGNIRLVAKQPEKLYGVYMDNGTFRAHPVAKFMTYDAAKSLAYELNQVIVNSGVEAMADTLFTVS